MRFVLRLAASPERVWAFHSSAEALTVLTPPERRVVLLSPDLAVREGAVHEMMVSPFPFAPFVRARWRALIRDVTEGREFTDVAVVSPFAVWRHRHLMEPAEGGGTTLTDEVEYAPPFGPLGRIADNLFIYRQIAALFAYRHARTREALDGPDGTSGVAVAPVAPPPTRTGRA